MQQFTILSSERNFSHQVLGAMYLDRDVQAFYHDDYVPGDNRKVDGTVENLICTLKNDIHPYPHAILREAREKLVNIVATDLSQILRATGKVSLRICVVPRAKREQLYRADQLYFRSAIQMATELVDGCEDGTHDIIRHTNTRTTHRNKSGNGGDGPLPYVGITRDTCTISDSVVGKDILLIDDLYTKTINIDEDCLQALLDAGARSVFFYSIGRTVSRY